MFFSHLYHLLISEMALYKGVQDRPFCVYVGHDIRQTWTYASKKVIEIPLTYPWVLQDGMRSNPTTGEDKEADDHDFVTAMKNIMSKNLADRDFVDGTEQPVNDEGCVVWVSKDMPGKRYCYNRMSKDDCPFCDHRRCFVEHFCINSLPIDASTCLCYNQRQDKWYKKNDSTGYITEVWLSPNCLFRNIYI